MPEPDTDSIRFPNDATPPGSSSYYSIRFGTQDRRPELALVFAWRREMRRIASETSDPGVARLKLDWWRGELERAASGAAQHPLARDLESAIARCR